MTKMTEMDTQQITRRLYDENRNASAVYLVDGISINTDSIEQSIKDAFKDIKIEYRDVIVKEQEIKVIEVPVIVYETKTIEIDKPIIVEQIRIVEIEKPVIIKETIMMEVKVPHIVIQKEYKELPIWVAYAVGIALALQILNLIANFHK